MGFLDTFNQLLAPARQQTRAIDPVIIGAGFANNPFSLNLDELTPDKQRVAYRSIVAMLINYRARILSKNFIKVTVNRTSGGELVPVEDANPLKKLLERPNAYMAPTSYYNWMYQTLDIQGHADAIVETKQELGRQVPIALHPIYTEFGRVSPSYGAGGNITGWSYFMNNGRTQHLGPLDVIRIKRAHPVAPWLTEGKVEDAAYEIDTLQAQNEFARDSARDQGRPAVMLEAVERLTRDQMIDAARDFTLLYKSGGSGMVPVSHSGLKIIPLNLTPEQLDFVQGQQFTREQLFMIFEVPIQIFSGEAYATGANSHRRGFMENTIQPELDDTASQYQFELERLFNVKPAGRFTLKPPNVIPVDEEMRAKIDQLRLATGVPLNRILAGRGEEEVIGGDVSLVPSSLVPLDLIGEGLL